MVTQAYVENNSNPTVIFDFVIVLLLNYYKTENV